MEELAKNHIKAIITENKRCNLIALCDNSNEKLDLVYQFTKNYLKERNIELLPLKFSSHKKLLEAHKEKAINIDLLVICTPSGLHAKQTIETARYGINICTEKPMALNVKDAEKMIKICKKNNVKLFVVKQNRFNKTLLDLKSKIQEGKFGKIGLVVLNVFWQRPQSYYDLANWRGTKKTRWWEL